MFKVGDYVLVKRTEDPLWGIIGNDALIVREIKDGKVTAQYREDGRKIIAFIEDCEKIEPIEVVDITLLFDCGVEKTICWVKECAKRDDGMTLYICANGLNIVTNPSKVCYLDTSPEYKVWVDKYGNVKRVAE